MLKAHKLYSNLFEDPIFISKVKELFVYFKENQISKIQF